MSAVRSRAATLQRSLSTVGVVVTLSLATSTPAVAALGMWPPVAATPTPRCEEWQTVTQVPVPGTARPTRPSSTTTPKPRTSPACRNAPPAPFPHPVWDPPTVVGGARLDATGLVVDVPAGARRPPAVPDVSYVLADLDTGEVLAAKAPHAWLRPASTLKTLTALTLIPRLDPARRVLATPEHEGADGTRVGILAGNRYPVSMLFDALLLSSANDAAYLLADAAGGYEQTVSLMNETAVGLGAHDTVAVDPSGLDEDGQHSSAYDLALIGRAAMRLPTFRSYVSKRDAVFPGGTNRATGTVYRSFQIQNINELLGRYPGAIGIKPGRTNRAQHTLIGAATRAGRTLIVTQMGSTTGDWKDTAALLDWGFANVDVASPVGVLVEPDAAPPPPVPAAAPPMPGTPPAPSAAANPTATRGSAQAAVPEGAVTERTAVGVATWGVTALAAAVGLGLLVLGLLVVARRHAGHRSRRSSRLR